MKLGKESLEKSEVLAGFKNKKAVLQDRRCYGGDTEPGGPMDACCS